MTQRNSTAVAMEKRRDRIVEEAGQLLSRDDARAFSLRKLAEAAGVTVPTLYNLIGNKDAILVKLGSKMLERIERELAELDRDHPLDMAEAVVVHATAMFAEDEKFCRAAHVALDHLSRAGSHAKLRANHHERCVDLQYKAVRKAQQMRLLRGDVDARLLAEQIYRNYRQAASEWAFGTISLDEFRSRGLLGVYLCLAADASDAFREALIERIRSVSSQSPGLLPRDA